mgnify:CR=1 FL=1
MAGAGVANGLAAGAGAPQALVLVLSQAIILCHYIRKEEWAVWRGKPRRGVQSEGVAQDLKGVLRTNTEVLFELMLFLFDSFLCSENSSALAHVIGKAAPVSCIMSYKNNKPNNSHSQYLFNKSKFHHEN